VSAQGVVDILQDFAILALAWGLVTNARTMRAHLALHGIQTKARG